MFDVRRAAAHALGSRGALTRAVALVVSGAAVLWGALALLFVVAGVSRAPATAAAGAIAALFVPLALLGLAAVGAGAPLVRFLATAGAALAAASVAFGVPADADPLAVGVYAAGLGVLVLGLHVADPGGVAVSRGGPEATPGRRRRQTAAGRTTSCGSRARSEGKPEPVGAPTAGHDRGRPPVRRGVARGADRRRVPRPPRARHGAAVQR